MEKTNFGVTFPAYAQIRAMQVTRATSEQLARKNSAARRRMGGTAQDSAAVIKADTVRFAQVVKDAKITID